MTASASRLPRTGSRAALAGMALIAVCGTGGAWLTVRESRRLDA